MARKKIKTCLRPGCGKESRTRGLCVACYSSAYELVRRGAITWATLEERGKARREHRRDRPGPARWFMEDDA